MIRLDEKQYRAVKKMTRAACANNDCGNCLLLDDGETCVCVQSISYSLLCRYFREAVLPADRQLCEQITRSGETDLKRCAVCGSTFAAGSNRAKYCPDCTDKNNYIASTANEYPFARNARAALWEARAFCLLG